MKTNVLFPILVIPFLTGCHVHYNNTFHYRDSDKYTRYTSEVTVSEKVEHLLVNYVSGSINIVKGTEFKLVEEQNEYPCYFWNDVDNKKFTVQFVENDLDLSNKDFSKKNLSITVPYDLKKLSLNLVSCDYSITAFNVDELDIDVVSCDGEVSIDGNKRVEFDSVSGALDLSIASTLNEEIIKIDTVSGDIELNLDQRRGFNIRFDSVSGEKVDNFGEPTDTSLSKYSIDIDTVSGDAIINKNN